MDNKTTCILLHVVIMEQGKNVGEQRISVFQNGKYELKSLISKQEYPVSILVHDGVATLVCKDYAKIQHNKMQYSNIQLNEHFICGVSWKNQNYLVISEGLRGTSEQYTEYVVNDPCELIIGRKDISDIRIHDWSDTPIVSSQHAKLTFNGQEWFIEDLGSLNGTYVNGQYIRKSSLRTEDRIFIMGMTIRISREGIEIYGTKKITVQSPALKKKDAIRDHDFDTVPATRSYTISIRNEDQKEDIRSKYLYHPSPRSIKIVRPETIEIEQKASVGNKPEINWLSVVGAPLVMVIMLICLVTVFGMSPIMLIMSGTMSILSIVTAFISYRSQKKKFSAKHASIDQTYSEYLDDVQKRIKDAHKRQSDILGDNNPSPDRCLSIVSKRDRHLWQRDGSDYDFLHVRLGIGKIPAAVQANFKRPAVIYTETEDDKRAGRIADRSRTIHDVPVLEDLKKTKLIGMKGHIEACIQFCRNVIVEITALHSPSDIRIVCLVSENDLAKWDWVRWLPHARNDEKNGRYLFTSAEEAEEALNGINEVLRRRINNEKKYDEEVTDVLPYYIFFITNPGIIEKHSIRKVIQNTENASCTTFYISKALPKACDHMIDMSFEDGKIYSTKNMEAAVEFRTDLFSLQKADQFARDMAPIMLETENSIGSVPRRVSFLEGYEVNRPEELNIAARWAESRTFKSLSVPIAAMAGGVPFEFDIHEKVHGVNGIVAGMPGSGKTEMVQSWLLSLAVNFSPQDVSFVLVDFKGTGLISPFRNLPHVAGTISNLDTNISHNLISLQNEVHRREKILARYSEELGKATQDINSVNKAYSKGIIQERLPVMIIVIDEFAEFKKNFPDFGQEIDSLTSKGRALGIFVVLMTQKPGGVVSAKSEDNIKFRWCLRVANYAASKEMLGKADAAKIQNPGRAFVKVGEDDLYEEVQSYWSGAPYHENNKKKVELINPISIVNYDGSKKTCERVIKDDTDETATICEIDAVVDYIAKYCEAHGIASAEKVWTESLPDRIAVTDLLEESYDGIEWSEKRKGGFTIGLLDDPVRQAQYPLKLDPSVVGHTVIYGAPVSGKTTLLKTIAASIAMTIKPDEASIYILDFGGWNMNLFRNFPHVGGIAFDNEPDRISKLCMLLFDMLEERKKLFASVGIGNIHAYRRIAGSVHLPDVYLLVDNFGAMIKMYPELDEFFITYTGSAANYGMYLIATANSSNAVPMKISQGIKNAIALQMIDQSDYTFLVGKVSEKLPDILGRGYIKGNPPMEFQAALPTPGADDVEISDNIQKVAYVMESGWDGSLPEPIPEMPDVIPYQSVSDGVMLGLSSDKVKPVIWDYRKQHYFMISGLPKSGKTSMLKAITAQFLEKGEGEIYLFDLADNGWENPKGYTERYLTTGAEADAFLEEVRLEMQRRYSEQQSGIKREYKPLIFVIDDYGSFFKAVSNDTMARLQAIVQIGKGLGLYLIIASDAYELNSYYSKGEIVATTMVKNKDCLMLGGSMNDHSSIAVNAKYAQKSQEVGEYEGYFVKKGDPLKIKAMMY